MDVADMGNLSLVKSMVTVFPLLAVIFFTIQTITTSTATLRITDDVRGEQLQEQQGRLAIKEESSPKMKRPRLILHPGPPKMSSTSIQEYMRENPHILLKDNILIPGRKDGLGPLARCLVNDEACQDPAKRRAVYKNFRNFLHKALKENRDVLISREYLSKSSVDIQWLRKELEPFKIQVIVLYRRLYDWVASRHFQAQRNQPNETYVHHYADGFRRSGKGGYDWFITQYTSEVAQRYSQISDDVEVTIVNMHDTDSIVESFYCQHISGLERTCQDIRDNPPQSKNTGHPLDDQHLLVEAQRQGLVDGSLETARRDKLVGLINFRLQQMEQGNGTVPQECLPKHVLDDWLNESIALETKLLPTSWLESDKGLKGLRDDFAVKARTKLCSIDTNAILQDPSWRGFLQNWAKEK